MHQSRRMRHSFLSRAVVESVEPRRLLHGAHDLGGGLIGEYFDNADFTELAVTRTDPTIDLYWHDESPAPAVGADGFSVRWTGQLLPPASDTYTITARTTDAARVWIGDQLLIDHAGDGQTMSEEGASIALTAGQAVDIRIELVEATGNAGVRLYWQTPTLPREIIPSDHLFSNVAEPPPAPPAQPLAVDAAALSQTQVQLAWSDDSAGVTGYEISRMTPSETATVVGTVSGEQRAFADSGLTPGIRYFYRVRGTSELGNSRWSSFTNVIAEGVGSPVQPPAPPATLTATLQDNQVQLAWSDTTGETGFVIERSADGGDFVTLASVGADTTEHSDTAVSAGVAYTYRVRAENLIGRSEPSTTATATVPPDVEPPPPASEFTQINWQTRESGPLPRSEAMRGTIDGKLYVFGGFSGSDGPTARADVYDPATNSWQRLADMPQRLTHAGTATDGRSVYIAGGYVGVGATGTRQEFGTREVWRYDVDTNTYTAMPDLPFRRASGALVVLGRELHYFSGNNADRQDVGDHYVLNLDGGTTWTVAEPLPNPRSHMGYVTFEGRIYAIAGQTGNDDGLETQGDVHVWDPAMPDVWTPAAPLPKPVSHISSSTFVMDGRIIVAGGESEHGTEVREVWAFDPAANTWTPLTPLPAVRHSGVADVIDGRIYFHSGTKTTTTWRGTPVMP